MKEQDYQKKIVKYLESIDAYVVKVVAASKKGVPDILACYKGIFIAIEVKTPDTMYNLSELQKYNIRKIIEAIGIAIVAYCPEQIMPHIDKIDEELEDGFFGSR